MTNTVENHQVFSKEHARFYIAIDMGIIIHVNMKTVE